nr:ABC transporter ATP-binding protein [Leptolyngbya sp. CCY15150]
MTTFSNQPIIQPSHYTRSLCEAIASDADTSIAIAAKQVSMVFQNGTQRFQALKDVDLEVRKGAIQLLMGPSGSGKTTLLSILGGILTPTSGTVTLLGQDITRMARSQLAQFRLKHIGFIFQSFNLFPALTAAENVALVLKVRGTSEHLSLVAARELLDRVGLGDKANNLPRDLSGGQKQRVAIARALVGNPCIIMADEPTAALDSQSGHAVIDVLRKLAKEEQATVLMVTHDPRIVDVADQVAYLEDGQIKAHPHP